MPGQILCAVDRSEQAPPVAQLGALLSQALGGELSLVHVVEPVPGSQGIGGRLRRMMELEGRELLAELDAAAGDCAADCMVRVGDPLNELLQLSSEGSASLIVVGSRGRGPLKAALLGSTSVRLATRSACPVVVASPAASRRLQEDGKRWSERRPTLVCGVDGSARGYEAVAVAAQLLERLGGRLRLVHAYKPAPPLYRAPDVDGSGSYLDYDAIVEAENRSRRRLLERAAKLVGPDVDVGTELTSTDPVSGLEAVAEREDANLIVVASRGRGPLASALLGSTSARLASSASRPVLIVPGPWTATERGATEVFVDNGVPVRG